MLGPKFAPFWSMKRDTPSRVIRSSFLGPALGAVLCASSACVRSASPPAALEPASGRRTESPAPAQPLSDREIERAYVRALRASALPAPLVGVRVEGGILTLVGRVTRGEERLRAAELAEGTRGVRAVVNRLVVEPVEVPSTELRQEIRTSLREESDAEFANVVVTVDGPRVRLEGFVPRARSRELAERAAWYVGGVTEVVNEILIRPRFRRSDREMEEEIVRALRVDPYLEDSSLRVSVEGGQARLTGAVQSMRERRRARERASVAGIVDVDDTELRVLPERGATPAYARPPISDGEMAAAVRDAFRADPRVPEQGIDVRARYGVVTLVGRVRTLSQKLAAGEDAGNAVGAWAVVNELDVHPEGGLPPGPLDRQVLARLRGHPSIDVDGVRVTASGGAVRLRGEVSSLFERRVIARVVATVPGVTSIDDQLRIRPEVPRRTDADIEAALRRELRRDPRVGSTRIDVDVKNGVVTLRGEVPDGEVHDAVLENVFEVGPVGLVDELQKPEPARFLWR